MSKNQKNYNVCFNVDNKNFLVEIQNIGREREIK